MGFAGTFFLRSPVKGEVGEEPTVESVEEEIGELTTELTAKQFELAALKLAREQAEKKLSEKAAAQAKRTKLEKELAEKQKELAVLDKELDL